jgi:hypothetical protein
MCMHHLKILVWVVVNSYQKKTKKKAMMMTTDLPVRKIGHQLIVVQIYEGRELPIFKRSFCCRSAFCAFDINKQKCSQEFFSFIFFLYLSFSKLSALNPKPFSWFCQHFDRFSGHSMKELCIWFHFSYCKQSCVLSRVLDLKGGGMVVEFQSWVMLPLGWIQWIVSKELFWDVPFSSLLQTSP